MTYRDLLQKMQTMSDEQLDMDVLILSSYNECIDTGENGEIEQPIQFCVAQKDMYKFPRTCGPCGMAWDGESYRPAFEVGEEDIAPDFVKCYDKGTPYFVVDTF